MSANPRRRDALAAASNLERALLTRSPAALLIVTRHGRIRCASPAAGHLLGMRHCRDLEGWAVQFLPSHVHVPCQQGCPGDIESCCRIGFPGQAPGTCIGRLWTIGTGSRPSAPLLIQLVAGPGGRESASPTAEDWIAGTEEIEDLLDQLQSLELILRSNPASEPEKVLLGHISHGLRTPTNGISLAAELLADSPLSQEQSTYLAAILHSSHKLTEYTETLLEYFGVRADHAVPEYRLFDLRVMLSDIMDAQAAGEPPVTLFVAPSVPRAVGGAADAIHRAMQLSLWAFRELGAQDPLEAHVEFEDGASGPAMACLFLSESGTPRCPIPPGLETRGWDQRMRAAAMLGLQWSTLEHCVETTLEGRLRLECVAGEVMRLELLVPIDPCPSREETPDSPAPAPLPAPGNVPARSGRTPGSTPPAGA